MHIEKLNETLYEKYEYSQLATETTEMMTDLEYVKTVSIIIAQLEGTSANTIAKKTQSEAFSLPKLSLLTFWGKPNKSGKFFGPVEMFTAW